MKGLKKLLTGILAATMIMGASFTAFAAEDTSASITIKIDDSYHNENVDTTKVAQSYTWYRLMDATLIEGTNKASYFVDSQEKANALVASGIFKATVDNNEDTAKALATYFATEAGKASLRHFPKSQSEIPAATDGSTEITGLAKGYYYITSTLGTNAIVQTLGATTIDEKNKYPSVDKKQKDADTADYTDNNVGVAVGDEVFYQITVNVPAATSDVIKVTDTMSEGLDFKTPNDITVTGYGAGTQAKVDGRTFTIVLDKNIGAATTSTITFTAVVNKDAIVDTGKKNKVEIEYGNYHNEDTVYYDIYRAGAFKYDGADGKELAGVKFILTKKVGENDVELNVTKHKDGYYYVDANGSSEVTTDANGFILIRGLDNKGDTYKLTETETLTGYNLLSAPVTLKLTKDVVGPYAPSVDSVDRNDKNIPLEEQTTYVELVTIANNTGSLLPSTGGIGTTIFYIIGGILIVAGVAYFIVRRKASAE